jgi:hypothetical protein
MRDRATTQKWSRRRADWLCACALLCAYACADSDDASDAGAGSSGGGPSDSGASTAGTSGTSGTGGSTTTGGTGGTGGGTSGSGGGDSDAGASCSPCIGATVGWGPDGGFVAFRDKSELVDCNTYRHTREPIRDPGQTMLDCERGVPCMGSGLHGIADVLSALSHPDVEQALGMKMVLFGRDSRPVDGTVLRIETAGSVIEVGSPCMEAGCNAIPAGVTTLVELLRAIDEEQLNLDPCVEHFE